MKGKIKKTQIIHKYTHTCMEKINRHIHTQIAINPLYYFPLQISYGSTRYLFELS